MTVQLMRFSEERSSPQSWEFPGEAGKRKIAEFSGWHLGGIRLGKRHAKELERID